MNLTILNGDVLDGLRSLPDRSIQCVVTSPPYWGLRDYGIEGQIGLETTLNDYVVRMVEVFCEVRRVLRDDGTVWLNLGDGYTSGNRKGHGDKIGSKQQTNRGSNGSADAPRLITPTGLKTKDLIGIPWRVAFALQEDGWYLRSDIIWSKPNPMPESVQDRPTKSHEYIFLLSKNASYYYDCEAIREPQTGNAHPRGIGITPKSADVGHGIKANDSFHEATSHYVDVPGGRNRRTVWEIAPQPMPDAHFATFPEAIVEPCIKAGSSEYGCCPSCGAPWVRIVEKGSPLEEWKRSCGADSSGGYNGESEKFKKQDALGKRTYSGFNARCKVKQQNASDVKRRILEGMREKSFSWKPSCECGEKLTVPCTVLDPFGGSGTVAKVAREMNRSAVLIELNPDYVEIAKNRLSICNQQTLDTGVINYEVVKC